MAKWIAHAGGIFTDTANAVVVDTAGNTYVAGVFSTNATFGSTKLTAQVGIDLYLAKLDANGAFVWAKDIEPGDGALWPTRLQLDSAGKLLLMASPAGDAGVNPPLNQLLVGKYEPSNGATIWSRKIKSTFFADTIGNNLAQDAAGNIYIAGAFSGTTDFGAGLLRTTTGGWDAFLLKLNSSGTTLAVRTFGQAGTTDSDRDDQAYGIALDGSGNIYVAGEFANSIAVGSTNLTSAGDLDMVVLKYDANLNLVWARQYGSTGVDYARGLTRDAVGNIFLFGSVAGAYTLGIAFPFEGFYVARLDGAGNLIWATPLTIGHNASGDYGFKTDSAGSILLSAKYQVAKFNSQGSLLWGKIVSSGDVNDVAIQNVTNLFVATQYNPALTLDGLTATNAGIYDAAVIKLGLAPTIPPAITVQPTNQDVSLGGSVTFVVGATGTAPLTYQWRLNGNDLATQTATTLTFNNVQTSQSGNYSVVVGNAAGSVTSQVATLTVGIIPPAISAQPLSTSQLAGSTANFSVSATGSPPFLYQWRHYGTNLAGATTAFLSVPSVGPASAGPYTVVVSNPGGSVTSQVATLTVTYNPPVITKQPTNTSVVAGGTAIFTVTAIGSLPMTFQWQRNGANLGPASASSPTLALNNVQPGNAGTYRVIVTNPGGTVISSNATLVVQSVLDSGPAFTWVKSGGGEFSDYGESVAFDQAGNIYLGGSTSGKFRFGTLTQTNDAGPFVLKLDPTGNSLWLRRGRNGNGQQHGVQIAIAGTNFFMAGDLAGSTSLVVENTAVPPVSGSGTFIVKYDLDGHASWVKRIAPASRPRIAPDGAGGVYVGGGFFGTLQIGTNTFTASNSDAFLARLDANGNPLWARSAHGLGNSPTVDGLKVDAVGNLWVSGYFNKSIDFGGTVPLTNLIVYSQGTPCQQCVVARLRPDGGLIWQTATTNAASIYVANLDIIDGTNAVVAGYSSSGTVTWGAKDLTGNLWIGRIDGAGRMLESSGGQFSPPQLAFSISADRAGNTYLAMVQTPNTNAVLDTGVVLGGKEKSRVLLARWSRDGTWQWGRTDGSGPTNVASIARALAIDPSGSPLFVGDWNGTNLLFGSFTLTNSPFNEELWLGKIQIASAAAPTLSSILAANTLQLSWPNGNWILLTTPDLTQPFAPFSYYSTTNPATGQIEVSIPVSGTQAFFILKGP